MYSVDSDSICDDCNHGDKESDEKPCCFCFHWVDGYLTATRYEPKKN